MLKELGVSPNDIDCIAEDGVVETLRRRECRHGQNESSASRPWRSGLCSIQYSARRLVANRRRPNRDDAVFQRHGSALSKNVPMLIGSVSEEGMRYSSNPTEAEWHATLAAALGEAKAGALIAAMKKAHPEKSIRTLSYGVQGMSARNNVQRMVKMKCEQGGAPVYQYYFTWQSPMLDGVAGAWHTAELAFCFDNTKRCEQGTGNTPEAQALAKKMSTAWANFARTGNPSQPGLKWTPSDSDSLPNHGLRQSLPHGRRSRRRSTQDLAELSPYWWNRIPMKQHLRHPTLESTALHAVSLRTPTRKSCDEVNRPERQWPKT